MNRLPIQVLVLSLIAVGCVIAYKGYDDDFVNFNRKTDMCVNKAKDQELCDEFLHCKTKLPDPLEKNFNKCIKQVYPDGSFGTCNDDTSLYQSSDKFNKYLNCLLTGLPEKSSLDQDGKNQYDVYKQCLHKVGDKCMKNH